MEPTCSDVGANRDRLTSGLDDLGHNLVSRIDVRGVVDRDPVSR